MMIRPTTKAEINRLKQINLIEYFTETDGNNFEKITGGALVYKNDNRIVIYEDHAYIYDIPKEQHPYKDIIGIIRIIDDCGFLEAIEKLREYEIVYDLKL